MTDTSLPVAVSRDRLEELVDLGVRAAAEMHHANLCMCLSWPDACVNGYGPGQWEHGDEPVFLATVLATIAVELEVEADGMAESWTRARGIADGLRRAARQLRGDQS